MVSQDSIKRVRGSVWMAITSLAFLCVDEARRHGWWIWILCRTRKHGKSGIVTALSLLLCFDLSNLYLNLVWVKNLPNGFQRSISNVNVLFDLCQHLL